MKKLFFCLAAALLLTACLNKNPDPIVFHGGIALDKANIYAMKYMSPPELKFLEMELSKVNTQTTTKNVMSLFGTPKTIILDKDGQKYLWSFQAENNPDPVAVYFDISGRAMEVFFDGGARFKYRQNLREITPEERKTILKLDERT